MPGGHPVDYVRIQARVNALKLPNITAKSLNAGIFSAGVDPSMRSHMAAVSRGVADLLVQGHDVLSILEAWSTDSIVQESALARLSTILGQPVSDLNQGIDLLAQRGMSPSEQQELLDLRVQSGQKDLRIYQLEQEVASRPQGISAEVDDLRQQLAALQSKAALLDEIMGIVGMQQGTSSIGEAEQVLRGLMARVRTLENQKAELERVGREKDLEIARLNKEIEDLKGKITIYENAILDVMETLGLERDLSKMHLIPGAIAALNKDIEELSLLNGTQTKEVETLKGEVEQARKRASDSVVIWKNLRDRMFVAMSSAGMANPKLEDIDSFCSRITQMVTDLETARGRVQSLESSLAGISAEKADLEAEIQRLSASQKTGEAEIEEAILNRADGQENHSFVNKEGTLAIVSDKGREASRPTNEDSEGYLKLKDGTEVVILSDGAGGMGAGDVASGIAVTTYLESRKSGKDVVSAMEDMNVAVLAERAKKQSEMTGTFVIIEIDHKNKLLRIVNGGDSRAKYFDYERGEAVVLTKDHHFKMVAFEAQSTPQSAFSLKHEGVDDFPKPYLTDAEIDSYDATTTPRNAILQGVTLTKHSPIFLKSIPFEALPQGGVNVLMSYCDGVYDGISESSLSSLGLSGGTVREIADRVVQAALNGGSTDNVSAIAYLLPYRLLLDQMRIERFVYNEQTKKLDARGTIDSVAAVVNDQQQGGSQPQGQPAPQPPKKTLAEELKELSKLGFEFALPYRGKINFWTQVAFGKDLRGRSDTHFRGYLQINTDQIPRAVHILREVAEHRESQGKSTHFKFLLAGNIDADAYAKSGGETPYGQYVDYKPEHPVIALYADSKDDIMEILEVLSLRPEWVAIEDERRKSGNFSRRTGTNAYVNSRKAEFRTLNYNNKAGYSEDVVRAYGEDGWREQVVGDDTQYLKLNVDGNQRQHTELVFKRNFRSDLKLSFTMFGRPLDSNIMTRLANAVTPAYDNSGQSFAIHVGKTLPYDLFGTNPQMFADLTDRMRRSPKKIKSNIYLHLGYRNTTTPQMREMFIDFSIDEPPAVAKKDFEE